MAGSRNKNVQEQNLETRALILKSAREFQSDPQRFFWLVHALHAHSLLPAEGILVRCEGIPDQGGWVFEGCWLTCAREFFEFSILVPYRQGDPPIVELWSEVTSTTPISAHQPGTGKSFGWLALDVLRELSTKPG